MKNTLKKFKPIYTLIIYILITTLFLTTINLIFPLNKKTNQIISFILIIIYSLITGIKNGLKVKEKAYIEGLKIGLLNISTLYLLSIITLNFTITLKRLLYYLIIISISILGCIIGINKKDTN
jgi:putative membrane protein (TIGR04086 family)